MPKSSIDPSYQSTLPLSEKIKIIKSHPCFVSLTEDDIKELACLSTEKKFHTMQIILKQDDFIDAVYLVVTGLIEVSKLLNELSNKREIPLALLQQGDAIGLDKTGFFSSTGLRTATLTALSDTILIGWTLKEFYEFIKNHSVLSANMRNMAETILRLDFIRQVSPFIELPTEYLSRLSREIEEVEVAKDAIVFLEGDEGNACYLVYSGQVEISMKDPDGSTHVLNILQKGMIFGEMALISDLPRNATAKMLEAGKLLILKVNQLQEIMATFQQAADYIWVLAAERARPVQKGNIEIHQRATDDQETIYILKDKEDKKYFQLSSVGLEIWKMLNGKHTIEDITIEILKKFKLFIPTIVADTIINLSHSGFIETSVLFSPSNQTKEKKTFFKNFTCILYNLCFIKYNINNLDNIITKSYRKFFYFFYNERILHLFSFISIFGFILFILIMPHIINLFLNVDYSFIYYLIIIYFINIAFTLIHELAHAYTTKMYGHEVNRMGILFYWIGMVAYTDTSDLWLTSNKKRAIVSAAGPYVDIIFAGIISIGAALVSSPAVSLSLWTFALLLYISAFSNLNPINGGDGYNILTNICNCSTLRLESYQWVLSLFRREKLPHLSKKLSNCVLIYWVSSICFLLIAVIFAYFLQYYLMFFLPDKIMGVPIQHLSWALPLYVCILFYLKARKS